MRVTFEINGKRIRLGEGKSIVGREASCDVVIQDPLVSRRHAQVVCEEENCYLSDMGSAHGVFLNDEKISEKMAIYRDDVIGIADVRLVVVEGKKRPKEAEPAKGADQAGAGAAEALTDSDATRAYKRPKRPKDRDQAKSRLRNPLYLALLAVAGALILLAVALSLIPEKQFSRKMLSQEEVMQLTSEYLDLVPTVSIEGLDEEQMLALAEEQFHNAASKFEVINVQPEVAYDAYVRYRKVLIILKRLDRQPEYYDRLLNDMNKCRQWIEQKVSAYMQEGWVAQKKGEWERAYEAYEMVIGIINKKDFAVAGEARRQQQQVAVKLPKRAE